MTRDLTIENINNKYVPKLNQSPEQMQSTKYCLSAETRIQILI